MGNSLVWEQWTPKMLEGDFEGMGGTGLAIMRKDLGIATGQHPLAPDPGPCPPSCPDPQLNGC